MCDHKHFKNLSKLNLDISPKCRYYHSLHFSKQEADSKRWRNLVKVTLLGSGKARMNITAQFCRESSPIMQTWRLVSCLLLIFFREKYETHLFHLTLPSSCHKHTNLCLSFKNPSVQVKLQMATVNLQSPTESGNWTSKQCKQTSQTKMQIIPSPCMGYFKPG